MDVVAVLVQPAAGKRAANVNKPEDDGWTPLMLACLGGVPSGESIAKFLFANGADRNAVAKEEKEREDIKDIWISYLMISSVSRSFSDVL